MYVSGQQQVHQSAACTAVWSVYDQVWWRTIVYVAMLYHVSLCSIMLMFTMDTLCVRYAVIYIRTSLLYATLVIKRTMMYITVAMLIMLSSLHRLAVPVVTSVEHADVWDMTGCCTYYREQDIHGWLPCRVHTVHTSEGIAIVYSRIIIDTVSRHSPSYMPGSSIW